MRNRSIPSRVTNAANKNGVMVTQRKSDFSFLTYTELLQKRGLLPVGHSAQDGWHVWQRVKSDEVVVKRSMVMAARHRPLETPNHLDAHSFGLRVLAAMRVAEIAALRERIGAA